MIIQFMWLIMLLTPSRIWKLNSCIGRIALKFSFRAGNVQFSIPDLEVWHFGHWISKKICYINLKLLKFHLFCFVIFLGWCRITITTQHMKTRDKRRLKRRHFATNPAGMEDEPEGVNPLPLLSQHVRGGFCLRSRSASFVTWLDHHMTFIRRIK